MASISSLGKLFYSSKTCTSNWHAFYTFVCLEENISFQKHIQTIVANKSVGGFFSGLTNYVEENKQWAQSMAADATAAIKENVKVCIVDASIETIFI